MWKAYNAEQGRSNGLNYRFFILWFMFVNETVELSKNIDIQMFIYSVNVETRLWEKIKCSL